MRENEPLYDIFAFSEECGNEPLSDIFAFSEECGNEPYFRVSGGVRK